MSELRDIVGKALHGWHGTAKTADELADHVTAVLIENAGGPEHIMVVKGVAWTVQHPLTERFDADTGGAKLFGCKFTQLADAVAEQVREHEGDGTYRVWRDESSVIFWERLK